MRGDELRIFCFIQPTQIMQIYTNECLINILEQPAELGEGFYSKVSDAQAIIATYEAIKDAKELLIRQYHFEAENYEQTVAELKNYFKIIKAAGGIVLKKNKVLFIKRLGKWDLPKGKIDKGEAKEIAAAREVAEECGISAEITRKIGVTWHTYTIGEKNILKKTTWYQMTCLEDATMQPQAEENITEIVWVKLYKADTLLANSYGTIRNIYQKFLMKMLKKML
ncbi:MAG: NUDIX hydrolase [Cytophagales bacterium]|nr:MAG: NUDIX hydrolase [Cytophagales bacterium]